jgi:uncharacterized membrane protein SpoIIM required for sporulation
MDIRQFVADNSGDWERLEALLAEVGRSGLGSLPAAQLRELGALHRKASADLAASRTFHADSRIGSYLNDLALRSHNLVYRAPQRGTVRRFAGLGRVVPETVRAHKGALAASSLIFLLGALVGGFGTVLDENVAVLILGGTFVERIHKGEFWVEKIFNVTPHSIASAGILTNNLSVAIALFALGVTGGLTALLLFTNGAMLGTVLVLCAQYGLLHRVIPFIIPHGLIEISAILLAGAGGLTVFDGWLSPGEGTRLQGLRTGARQGFRIALAAAPALLVAGPVEGLISPIESLPAALRIALGVILAAAFWSWVLIAPPDRSRSPTLPAPRPQTAAQPRPQTAA